MSSTFFVRVELNNQDSNVQDYESEALVAEAVGHAASDPRTVTIDIITVDPEALPFAQRTIMTRADREGVQGFEVEQGMSILPPELIDGMLNVIAINQFSHFLQEVDQQLKARLN